MAGFVSRHRSKKLLVAEAPTIMAYASQSGKCIPAVLRRALVLTKPGSRTFGFK
jgi:hypothetical protein